MAQSSVMTIGIPGIEILINYHQQNKRIQSVEWVLVSGANGQAWIWDTDIDPINPIYYSGIVVGPDSDTQNVPGNYQMVQNPDGYDELPSNIIHRFEIETAGI